MEGLLVGLLLGGLVHGLNDGGGQGHGHVANAHFDDLVVGVLLGVGGHLLGDGDKQVALLQVLEIAVQLHLFSFLSLRIVGSPGVPGLLFLPVFPVGHGGRR